MRCLIDANDRILHDAARVTVFKTVTLAVLVGEKKDPVDPL